MPAELPIVPDYPVVELDCGLIDWPSADGTDPERFAELATEAAEAADNCVRLAPILVIPDDAHPNRYLGVSGRTTFDGIARHLGRSRIAARVVAGADSDAIRMIELRGIVQDAPLDKVARGRALAEWAVLYRKRLTGRDQTSIQHEEGADPNRNVAQAAADWFGVEEHEAKRAIRIGDAFSPEQLAVLDGADATEDMRLTIARCEEPTRIEVVRLVASGLDAMHAYGTATGQETFRSAGGHDMIADPARRPKGRRKDADLDDDTWLEKHCYSTLARLEEPGRLRFRLAALDYRRTADIRKGFNEAMGKYLDEVRNHKGGSSLFLELFDRAVYLDHPKDWGRCGECQGRCVGPDGALCARCEGKGFRVVFSIPKPKAKR